MERDKWKQNILNGILAGFRPIVTYPPTPQPRKKYAITFYYYYADKFMIWRLLKLYWPEISRGKTKSVDNL